MHICVLFKKSAFHEGTLYSVELPERAKMKKQLRKRNINIDTKGNKDGKRGNQVHGNIYQLKLLMLFLYRGVSLKYSFRLGTEIEEAKKFDDLVFECTQGEKKEYRLLQAKHRLGESKKITADDLLSENDGDYSLIKYFFSYQDSKKEPLFKGGIIKDVMVCTNIGLDFDSLKGAQIMVEEIKDEDKVLDTKSDKKLPQRYRFNKGIISLLKPKLENYNLIRLARRLVECCLKRALMAHHQENDMFKIYHIALAEEVIDVKTKTFCDKFVRNENLSQNAKTFRKGVVEEIQKQSRDELTLEGINEVISNKRKVIDGEEIGLNLSKHFGKGDDRRWPTFSVSNDQVNDYLDHLVFVVNQPNEEELGNIVKEEIGKEFDFITAENVYNKFFITMLNWLQGKERGRFLSFEEGKQFFEDARKEFSTWSLVLAYENELKATSIQFERTFDVEEFIQSGKGLWPVSTQTPLLTSLFFYQALKESKKNAYLNHQFFVKLNDLVEKHKSILPLFKVMNKSLLIIVCQHKRQEDNKDLPEIIDEIEKIISEANNNSKRLIVIAPSSHTFLMELRKKLLCYSDEVLNVEFCDLTQESQKACWETEKFSFQGQEEHISLKELLDLGDTVSQKNKISLHASVLEVILKNSVIKLWNKQPQLCNLESAHYKMHNRIGFDSLKLALASANPEVYFAFVGEENEVKQLIPDNSELKRFQYMITESLPSHHFVLLDSGKEHDQFRILCQLIDASSVRKKDISVQPVLQMLKQDDDEWVWVQTFTRDFYMRRSFYPVVLQEKGVGKLMLKPDSSDFIVLSGIKEDELMHFFNISNQEDNFKKNTLIVLDETAAQEKYKCLISKSNGNKKSIHWLNIKEGKNKKTCEWCDSWGGVHHLQTLVEKSTPGRTIDEVSLAQKSHQLMVLADEPGMGKSTTLASVAEFIQKEQPISWVIKLDLNREQQLLSKKLIKKKTDVVDLLFCMYPTLEKNPLTEMIILLKLDLAGHIVLLCDGFDEVKLEKQDKVLNLFKFLKQETLVTVWVTTREHDQQKLEEHLAVLAYSFEPLNEEKQIHFLSKFWITALNLEGKTTNSSVLENCAEEVVKRFEVSIETFKNDDDFISIPLRVRMLAEVFHEDVKKALAEEENSIYNFKADEKLVIGDLYRKFIDKKYSIYLGEKTQVHNGLDLESQAILVSAYTKHYERLALNLMFNSKKTETFIGNKKRSLSLNTLSRIGLIQGNEEPANFIHRTFSEYFAGKWLAEHSEKLAVKQFLCVQLFKKESSVVRRFFDYFLTQDLPLHCAVIKGDAFTFKQLFNNNLNVNDTDCLGRTVLHLAAQEGNYEFVQYLNSADSLVADQFGKIPLHYATCLGHTNIITLLFRNLIDIDLDDHIFRIPLHLETDIGDGNSLFNNVNYMKSEMVKLVNKLDESYNTPIYYAADNEYWEAACELVLYGADISKLSEERLKKLLCFAASQTHGTYANSFHHMRPVVGLLSLHVPEAVQGFSDGYEYPRLLSYFFESGHTKVVEALLESIQDFDRRKRIVNMTDNNIKPLRRIIENYDFNDDDHLKVVDYLFNQGLHHGIEIDSHDKGILLLVAATKGNLNTFKYLVEHQNVSVDFEMHNFTAVDRALMQNNQLLILKYLWENHRLSVNKSSNGTPLHIAAYSANLQATIYLCSHSAKINARDKSGQTPLHCAAEALRVALLPVQIADIIGHETIVQYLIDEGAEISLVDKKGKTALDLAIVNRQWATTKYLIQKYPLPHDSLPSKIKRFFDSPTQNPCTLHEAIRETDLQWIQFLLDQQLNVNYLDPQGRTCLHWAAVMNWPDKTKTIEFLLQLGIKYDIQDKSQKTALDLLRENFSEEYDKSNQKSIWLLQLIDDLINSNDLMQILNQRLLQKCEKQTMGPYGVWHPDVYDQDNPMQFVLNLHSASKGNLLHVAANTRDLVALKCLLKFNQEYLQLKLNPNYEYTNYQGIDINGKDKEGNTPLHLAAQQGIQEMLVLLLQEGAIYNEENNQKQTPKLVAKVTKHQEIVKFLQRVEDLFEAVKDGKKLDVAVQKELVFARNCDGKTLLHLASLQGQIETIKVLLDCIDPLNQRDFINVLDNACGTPLHDAATKDQTAVICFLLQQGAQFNIKDKQGKTPLKCLLNHDGSLLEKLSNLFYDLQFNRPGKFLETLRNFDASPENLKAIVTARDKRGFTLLHWAARENMSDIILELLLRGAIYDAGDNNFKSNDLFLLIREWMYNKKPLCFSIEEFTKNPDKLTVVKNARDYCGKTPLHANTNYYRLKYLLDQGANLFVQDAEGNTPLHLAAKRGDSIVAKLFIDYKADVSAKNKKGLTPLDLAAMEDFSDIVALFSPNSINFQPILYI